MKQKFSYSENLTLALATFLTAIMAGFFYTYTINVNLAMMQVDGETYATVQSLFNENVRHWMFFIFFFGSGVVGVLAILANWKKYKSVSFWLIVIAALVYIFGVIAYTAGVNLPLNAYTESWNPTALPLDWEATRDAWNQANAIRVFTAGFPFLCYLVALVLRASD